MIINLPACIKLWLLCVLANSTLLLAAEERFPLTSQQQRQAFTQLTANLRCPKCQNQSIADSNATVSVDMKRKVHQLLLQGKSEDYIITYMKQRYGDFVYYQPPVNTATLVLWMAPLLVLFVVLWLFLRQKREQPRDIDALDSKQLEDVDALLNKNKLKDKDVS